jgi:hypothetical protein
MKSMLFELLLFLWFSDFFNPFHHHFAATVEAIDIEELIRQMTVKEKIGQMTLVSHNKTRIQFLLLNLKVFKEKDLYFEITVLLCSCLQHGSMANSM